MSADTVEEQVQALVPAVLEHFRKNRPDPASFPSMAARVIDVAENPDVDIPKLAHLIERDPAIAASVLRLANSAMYRRPNPIQSVRAALTLLGLKQIVNVALSIACRSLFDIEARVEHDLYPKRWSRLYHHALTTAFSGGWFTIDRRLGRSDTAFMAGMFHDIGKSIGLRSLSALITSGKVAGIPADAVIDEVLEGAHVEIGAEMHATWRLPDTLTEICRHHHGAELPDGPNATDLHIVRVFSGLNGMRTSTTYGARVRDELLVSARALALDGPQIRRLLGHLKDFADQVTTLFAISEDVPNPDFDAQIDELFGPVPV